MLTKKTLSNEQILISEVLKMTKLQPQWVKLQPGEVVNCKTQGFLKQPNPKWDGRVPKTEWGTFWQGCLGRTKYENLYEDLDLYLYLTNQRFFIEPCDYGAVMNNIGKLIITGFKFSSNPYAKYKAQDSLNRFNEAIDSVSQLHDSGRALVEIDLNNVEQLFIDSAEYTYILQYSINDQKVFVYFSVFYDDHDKWDRYLKSMLKEKEVLST
ncbi:MAG: hypothetical protein WBM44_19925 [Waterburya sp.]